MQQVCRACHSKSFVKAFYEQLDAVIELYNKKFAEPDAASCKRLPTTA